MTNKISQQRYLEMLKTALGAEIMQLLSDNDVIEIMVNPDGAIYVDSLVKGKYPFTGTMQSTQTTNVIKLVAAFHNQIANEQHPNIAAILPIRAARFQGWLPPVVRQPTFNIRKRALRIFTLEDYVKDNIINAEQKDILQMAINERKNILIVGGTSSGKTTLANAILHELYQSNERIIILEDIPELQLTAKDVVFMQTTPEVSMRDLVKGVLRMRPDRIIVGEVRDGSALELIKAWNTGHPGSISTLHANSATDSLLRLEDLIREVIPIVPKHLLQNAIDLIVHISRDNKGKRQIEIKNWKRKQITNHC